MASSICRPRFTLGSELCVTTSDFYFHALDALQIVLLKFTAAPISTSFLGPGTWRDDGKIMVSYLQRLSSR